MENNEKLIDKLQQLVTGLFMQADLHDVQYRIFKFNGYYRLADRYRKRIEAERIFTRRTMKRILELGGEIKIEERAGEPVYSDPIEALKYDLDKTYNSLSWVKEALAESADNFVVYYFLIELYKYAQESINWLGRQVRLAEVLGKENWYLKQL